MKNCWPHKPLQLLVTITGGGTPTTTRPEFFQGTIPWVTPKDMKRWYVSDSQVHLTEEGVQGSTARIIPPRSVLVVIRSGVLKHTLPIALNTVPVAVNQDLKALICGPEVYPDYLARALQWMSPQLLKTVRGTTADNISSEVLRRVEIPLPSLGEQKRIAAILDKADAIHHKRREVLRVTDELIPSLFNDAFRKWLDQPVSAMPQLGDPQLAEVVSGVTKGRHFNGQPTVTVPYIRVANVQDGYLDLSEIKTIEALPSDVQSLSLQRGDVLMTEGGDFDKLGRGAMYEADIPDCIHQNHVFRVRCNRSRILPIFFATYIRTQFAKAYFLKCAKKTSNLASINMTQLRALPVACPPIDCQRRFAKEVEVLHRVRRQQVELADHADDLFGSLVQRAFRGEL